MNPQILIKILIMSHNSDFAALHLLGSETGPSFVCSDWGMSGLEIWDLTRDVPRTNACRTLRKVRFLYIHVLGQNQVTANRTLVNHIVGIN